MPVRRYGLFLAYAPGTRLHSEGLGRLLAAFLRASSSRPEIRITVVCPSWTRADLQELLRQEGRLPTPPDLVTPSGMPIVLRLVEFARRRRRWKPKRARWLASFAAWVRHAPRIAWEGLLTRLVTARSGPVFGLWLLFAALIAVLLLVPLLLAGICWLGLRIATACALWFGRRRIMRRTGLWIDQTLRAPSKQDWAVRLYRAMMDRELTAMVALADRQGEVRAWFSPAAFWPEVCRCRAPHLICIPDIVFAESPVGFAQLDAGGRFAASLARIETTLRQGQAFTTYSRHVADLVLIERHGVPAERITVIPHAAARLDRLVEVRGFPDNAAASRTYCQRLLLSALQRATQRKYAERLANPDLRFLFYASQFRPSKNIIGLLRAYERLLRRDYLGHKLLLTGDPEIMPEVERFLLEHRLEHDVLCLRNLTSPELAACYKLADLAVNPTFSEGGCPFTLTEALSVGTPVVMGRIAVTTEIVDDPALQAMMLFDPRDPECIAERIRWAVANRQTLLDAQLPLYRRLAERTWDHVLDEHIAAMERGVTGHGDPGRR